MSHISVERKRRRQMNEHLKVLRSLTPRFYVKRGDQASIVEGVIEYIRELHQVLQSLESKKRRKSLSPSPPSPNPTQLKLTLPPPLLSPPLPSPLLPPPLPSPLPPPTPTPENHFGLENVKEMGANCSSQVAEVEAKISGSNVILRTVSKRTPGQFMKIITLLEKLAFEILKISISSMEDTVSYSFLIKIGLECQLSLEDLAAEVQQSFCQDVICVKQRD